MGSVRSGFFGLGLNCRSWSSIADVLDGVPLIDAADDLPQSFRPTLRTVYVGYLTGGWAAKGLMADINIDIDTGTVTVPVDLGIWQHGERLDLRLDEPTPVGAFLDDLVRLLGLPRRTWDGQRIDYWLHPRDEVARLEETVKLNEVEVPQNGLVLAASQSALDIRAELDRLAKGINEDIRAAIDEEIQRGIDEVRRAAAGELSAVIREVREQVTRRVTDLIPTGRRGVKAQFLAAVGLRKMARTDALVEYQDAVELGLGRARGYSTGVWRAFGGLAAQTGAAGAAGTAAATAAVTLVAVVTYGAVIPGPKGDDGVDGAPGQTVTIDRTVTVVSEVTTTSTEPPTTTAPPLRTHPVVPGDTLWEITTIECKGHPLLEDFIEDLLSIWVANIEEVGSDPNNIDVGQVLTLPCDPPP